MLDALGDDRHSQEIAVWIAREKLRDVLNLRGRPTGSAPCEQNVPARLFRCYDWCVQKHRERPPARARANRQADPGGHDVPGHPHKYAGIRSASGPP
jgi:hypothetical protein